MEADRPAIYRPRKPRASPLWQCVSRHLAELRASGRVRRVVERNVLERFLECGDPHHGFARIRCGGCAHDLLLAFSCKTRYFCPSCHQKRVLAYGEWVESSVLRPVPHRQYVFTVPKLLRPFFAYRRSLLGELCRLVARSLAEAYRAGCPRGRPGFILFVQTFGDLVNFNPHVHALAADGVFEASGRFIPLPPVPEALLAARLRREVLGLLVRREVILAPLAAQMLAWRHNGFSIHNRVRVAASDAEARARRNLLSLKLEQLIVENRIEAYNFPEGVMTQLYRDIGARKPGTLSRVGLGTYIDPRHGGGRMNDRTTEDIVRLMPIDGEDFLFFKAFPINVALIRGTTADPDGNITTERESLALENLALAIAARNSGGIVIAQVERVAAEGTLDARTVKVPGILVDCVVLTAPEHHMQTYGTQFNPAFSGELRLPPARVRAVDLNDRKVIARRAVLELAPNSVINVGVGSIPDQVPLVAGEERVQDLLSLAVDSGVIGGVPMSGLDFGAAVNYQAVIDHACAFDFIDGGGLDAAFLGFGECDAQGNVNASKFGKRTPGCGGFIDISQNAKKVVFMGTFNSGGLEVGIDEGRVRIIGEGRFPKFVDRIGQTTFSAAYARSCRQEVLYVTERCVFRLEDSGLALIEVAPGIDVERDILQRLPFGPAIIGPREMDPRVFRNAPMRLREQMLDLRMEDRLSYDAETNTVYMNYAGLRVRDLSDLAAIGEAVDNLLAPLGKRVHSIVNYERFTCDDDVFDEYIELVKRVEQTYYLSVKRYTSGAFLRHKLGAELAKRHISSEIIDSTRRDVRKA